MGPELGPRDGASDHFAAAEEIHLNRPPVVATGLIGCAIWLTGLKVSCDG
jgi:hypothetical protein